MSACANTPLMVAGADVVTSVQQALTPLGVISAHLPSVLSALCDGYLQYSYYTRTAHSKTEEHKTREAFLQFMRYLPQDELLRVTEIAKGDGERHTTQRGYRLVSEWVAEYSTCA
jgi:hypothetical protein